MSTAPSRLSLALLQNVSLLLFAAVIATFGCLSPKFLSWENATNILVQSAPTGVVATGMTFVLLTAGVDLSVGAIMFLTGAIGGSLLLAGHSLGVVLAAMLAAGLGCGAINAFFITRLKVAPFIVTLALLFVGRGLALTITQTRAMNLPESFLHLGVARIAGVPVILLVLVVVVVTAQLVLTHTAFGRHIYALGNNPKNAVKAGLPTTRLLTAVYLISAFCAVIGGMLSLTQLGAVSPKFGEAYEFQAIAATVLGGTSLFGGRGGVLPGTLLGAVLIQSLQSGLVIINADPYIYPMVTAGVIFVAVLIDSLRHHVLAQWTQRRIRREPATG